MDAPSEAAPGLQQAGKTEEDAQDIVMTSKYWLFRLPPCLLPSPPCQSRSSIGDGRPQRRCSFIKPPFATLPSSALLAVVKPMKKRRSSVSRLAIDEPHSCATSLPPPTQLLRPPPPPHRISKLVRPDAWPVLAHMQMTQRGDGSFISNQTREAAEHPGSRLPTEPLYLSAAVIK